MRRHRYRRSSAFYGKYYFSESEIDFTRDYFNYEQFLLQEFFTADVDTQRRIQATYLKLFGARSYNYLARKYREWREGDYHLTNEIRGRIIDLMPKLLPPRAIHAIGLYEFSRAIKGTVSRHLRTRTDRYKIKRDSLTLKEWQSLLLAEHKAIEQLSLLSHQYHPLSADDANAALYVAQYILRVKLTRYEEQVMRDLVAIQPVFPALNIAGAEITYHMRQFAAELNLATVNQIYVADSGAQPNAMPSEGSYQTYADKYFAYELAQTHSDINREGAKAASFPSDLNLCLQQIETLIAGEMEASLKQDLQGEGGVLKVRVNIVPSKLALSTMRKAAIRLTSTVLGTVLYIVVMMRFGLITLLVFSALIILPLLLPTVAGLVREIKRARKAISTP